MLKLVLLQTGHPNLTLYTTNTYHHIYVSLGYVRYAFTMDGTFNFTRAVFVLVNYVAFICIIFFVGLPTTRII